MTIDTQVPAEEPPNAAAPSQIGPVQQNAEDSAESCARLAWSYIEQGDLPHAKEFLLEKLRVFPRHALLHAHLGVVYQRTKELDRAAYHLMQALQINPRLDDAATTLAWVLHDMGQLAAAAIWARRALSLQPSPERQAQLGWLLLCLGQTEEAARLFTLSLDGAPNNFTTYLQLSRCYQQIGEKKRALETLDRGLACCPDTPELLLDLGWLHHGQNNRIQALRLADRVNQLQPENASGWHLRGVCHLTAGDLTLAVRSLEQAYVLKEDSPEIAFQLAFIYYKQNRQDDAILIVSRARMRHPVHVALGKLHIQLAMDRGDWDTARALTHDLINQAKNDGDLWYFLAVIMFQRKRTTSAKRMLHRTLQLDVKHHQAYLLLAQVALSRLELDGVRWAVSRWLKFAPNYGQAAVQAALVLADCGDLVQAGRYAELGIALDNQSSEAWRSLGRVRQLQGRLEETLTLTQIAISMPSASSTECLRQLGWTQRAKGQVDKAIEYFAQAAELEPSCATVWYELADTATRIPNATSVQRALDEALSLDAKHPQALLLQTKLLADGYASDRQQATKQCAMHLREKNQIGEAAQILLELVARGQSNAADLLKTLPRSQVREFTLQALANAQDRASHPHFSALTTWAHTTFPDDAGIEALALYENGLLSCERSGELAVDTRNWQRSLTTRRVDGTISLDRLLPLTAGRLRLAYVASHYHSTLLSGVLAAHDPDRVDVFLYCDLHGDALRGLPERVHLIPLRDCDLMASMHANRIDVAIDTVGVTGVLGQDAVLRQFAQRVAPVQCAWLGSWASAGGVFDSLLTDEFAVPTSSEVDYSEQIVRLPGGQWSWVPPTHAPPPSPPPCLIQNRIVLACPVRAFRISSLTLQTWARLLRRIPHADLILMGEHGANASFRMEVEDALRRLEIPSSRVRYQPRLRYNDFLASFSDVDIVLDTFPANGGLCLLDALWMGLPCVTLAGQWIGERQGLSILAAVGHPEWSARDTDHYIEIACALANQPAYLASLRRGLRHAMSRSPLLDSHRLACALENALFQLRKRATPAAQAPTPKERARALAKLQLDHWLESGKKLTLTPVSDRVDVSVIVVLFNQAGLSRQCFAALADQRGICFETIVVDNASSDRTQELLDRIDGVTLIHNSENVGFLQAANQGAARAKGRHILFLNNDAIVHANALHQGVHRLDSDSTIGAVGGRIVLGNGLLQEAGCIAYQDGSTQGYGRGQNPHAPEFSFVRDADFCSGAFLMLRREVWAELGGFDSGFAPAYYEDTDLCLRMQDAGYRVVYDPSIWLSHFEWASTTATDGATRMMEARRERFAQRHQQRLASRVPSYQALGHRDRWLAMPRPHTLLIDNGVPHAAGGGGMPRARLMVHALATFHHLTVFPLWNFEDDWRAVYASVPENVEVILGRGAGSLESFLEERVGVYGFLVVSRPPNMEFVEKIWSRRPELFSGMHFVYDAEAIFALREIGSASLRGHPMPKEQADQLVRKELALAHRAETVLCVSMHEAELFRSAGNSRVALLDHSMLTRSETPGWDKRRNLLFVGAIHPNTPNEDSLLWFSEQVLPLLHAMTAEQIRIDVVGDCTSDKVLALASDCIQLMGRVDNLTPVYDSHRVFVAPTRFGAGVPAKVIEAACNGIPVVATSLLVNQLGWSLNSDIACGDDASAFAEAILHLYEHKEHWNNTRANMAHTTRTRYDPSVFLQTLRTVFGNTCELNA